MAALSSFTLKHLDSSSETFAVLLCFRTFRFSFFAFVSSLTELETFTNRLAIAFGLIEESDFGRTTFDDPSFCNSFQLLRLLCVKFKSSIKLFHFSFLALFSEFNTASAFSGLGLETYVLYKLFVSLLQHGIQFFLNPPGMNFLAALLTTPTNLWFMVHGCCRN